MMPRRCSLHIITIIAVNCHWVSHEFTTSRKCVPMALAAKTPAAEVQELLKVVRVIAGCCAHYPGCHVDKSMVAPHFSHAVSRLACQ